MERIDAGRLSELCRTVPFVRRTVLLEETASTNDDAQRMAAEGAPEGTVIVALSQTAGRGRFARTWHSAPGLGLYLSVVLRPTEPLELWTRWTIAAAVAACDACREASACDVVIKWPNDLLIGDRKVGGILAELRSMGGTAAALVVGTGINVNHAVEDFPAELRERATSLRAARAGPPLDATLLAARYLSGLGEAAEALRRGRWSDLVTAWSDRAPGGNGRRVRVVTDGDSGGGGLEGTTRGLDATGALRIERPDGEIVALRSGESIAAAEG